MKWRGIVDQEPECCIGRCDRSAPADATVGPSAALEYCRVPFWLRCSQNGSNSHSPAAVPQHFASSKATGKRAMTAGTVAKACCRCHGRKCLSRRLSMPGESLPSARIIPRHLYRGSLQLLLSLNRAWTRSLPQILFPARLGFALKERFLSAKCRSIALLQSPTQR
jgi:hypothetical protein